MDHAEFRMPPPPPRPLDAFARPIVASFGRVKRWLGIFFVGHGAIMTTVFGWGLPVDLALDSSGVRRSATVVSATLNPSRTIDKRPATRITYRYADGRATYEDDFHTIDGALIASARPGATLPIEVLPAIPSWSRVAGERNAFFGYLGLFLALEPVAGFVLFVAGASARRRAVRAWENGVPVPAKIAYVTGGRTRVNRNRSKLVAWNYVVDGVERQSAVDTFSPAIAALHPGAELTVLVDRAAPEVSVPWIPS